MPEKLLGSRLRDNDLYLADLREALTSIPSIESLFGRRILVTGATGMLCSPIVDLLLLINREFDAKVSVVVAGRSQSGVEERFGPIEEAIGLEFCYYDATSAVPISLDEPVDYIIHGASNANPSAYMEQPVETMMANIVGLTAMLEVAREKAGSRILYVSSSEVYGRTTTNEPFTETEYGYLDILDKRAGYPSSKRAGESLCVAYSMEYGVDAVIVRPGHIYGPTIKESDNRASAEFTRSALAGNDIVMRSLGTQLRSYCYAIDCASAILAVLVGAESGNAFNISNPDSICSISDVAHEIARATGVTVQWNLEPGANQVQPNLMDNSALNSAKLEALGWTPRFDLAKGISHTVEILRAANQ